MGGGQRIGGTKLERYLIPRQYTARVVQRGIWNALL
jgi:hypothetical protein